MRVSGTSRREFLVTSVATAAISLSRTCAADEERKRSFRVGAVSVQSRRGQKQKNLDRIIHYGKKAAEEGCSLVLYPEFSVNGPWVTYDPEADLSDLVKDAETIPGPTTERLHQRAKELGLVFCVGLAEKGIRHKPFNAHVSVGPEGILHVQRKLEPTTSETAFYRGGGDDLKTFSFAGHTSGVVICADNASTEIHETLHKQGADIILAPHAGAMKKYNEPGDSWEELIETHRKSYLPHFPKLARKLGVTVVYCDLKDPREKFEDKPEWIHYNSGKTAIFDPNGEIIAENAGNEEKLVTAKVG